MDSGEGHLRMVQGPVVEAADPWDPESRTAELSGSVPPPPGEPEGYDPIVPRYTQDNVISAGEKTRTQILGEPLVVNGKQTRDPGYQLRQFDQMLRANGLATRLVVVVENLPDDAIRADLIQNLRKPDDYVIVNYRREAVGQRGGGHISPLGAYDVVTDSFLVLDVNPAAAGWVWMSASTLIKGMRTFDTVENRGYVLVSGR